MSPEMSENVRLVVYNFLFAGTDTKFFHYVQTSSGKVEFHPNGSLVIKSVAQSDEGYYR